MRMLSHANTVFWNGPMGVGKSKTKSKSKSKSKSKGSFSLYLWCLVSCGMVHKIALAFLYHSSQIQYHNSSPPY